MTHKGDREGEKYRRGRGKRDTQRETGTPRERGGLVGSDRKGERERDRGKRETEMHAAHGESAANCEAEESILAESTIRRQNIDIGQTKEAKDHI
jgi:hypothetical protein